jgi:hypothetical protein
LWVVQSKWSEIELEDLLGALGAVVVDADAARLPTRGRVSIERAIAEAAAAVALTVAEGPHALERARQAIRTAEDVIRALDTRPGRARGSDKRGEVLTVRAQELLDHSQVRRV